MKTAIRTIILPILVIGTSVAHAQIDRSIVPKAGPPPQVQLAEAKVHVLPNGMTLLLLEDHRMPMVSFQLKIDAEPLLEGDKAGMRDLMGALLRAGTPKMGKADMDQRIDALGATVSTNSSGFYASCLSRSAVDLLPILRNISMNCVFPPVEVEKAKKKMLSGLAASEKDPNAISTRVGDVLRFKKGHPYGQVATEESVSTLRRKHIKSYYDHFFVPENAYFVVVGDINSAQMIGTIGKLFNAWGAQNDARAIEEKKAADALIGSMTSISEIRKYPAPPRENHVAFVDRAGAVQSVIDITYPVLLTPNDPNALVVQVMNGVLGGGAFNARLNQNLREDKAFTYGAYSSLNTDEYIGAFSARTSVRNAVTDSTITEILYEMRHMKEEEVSDEELALAKNMMAGSFGRALEDPRTIARFALNTILYKLDPAHYRTYLQRLDTISKAAVLAMARNYMLPDNAHILIVGNKEDVANKVSKFAKRGTISYLNVYGERFMEDIKPPPAGVSADQVIDDYLAAIGGISKLAGRKTETIKMTTEVNGLLVDYVSYRKYPNKYMAKMSAQGMELQRVMYDGARGIRSDMGETGELMDVELAELSYEADMNFNMKYKQLSFDVRLVGLTTVKGKKAYKLLIITDSGNTIEEYYDVKTKLKLKKVERQQTSSGLQLITTYYDEYKAVEGILYPHRITKNAGMKMVFEVQSVDIDKELNDELFFIP